MFQGAKGSAEVSINSKQANRTLLLKQLARDLCISERRILYRSQYVSQQSSSSCLLFSMQSCGYPLRSHRFLPLLMWRRYCVGD